MPRKKVRYVAARALSRLETGEFIAPGEVVDLVGWGRTAGQIALLLQMGAVREEAVEPEPTPAVMVNDQESES